jgi:hypothetical protein
VITKDSPRATRSSKPERWVLALKAPMVFIPTSLYANQLVGKRRFELLGRSGPRSQTPAEGGHLRSATNRRAAASVGH